MASSNDDITEQNKVISNEENSEKQVPEWELAKRGIKLILNNNPKDAEVLFKSYPNSLIMFAGYSFGCFMDALMTFEEDRLVLAQQVLKEVERRCTSQASWLRSVKKVFGSQQEIRDTLAEDLETQIILADSQVCYAILVFLQQDISEYFKGGWVLRKAWKIYQATYHEISHLYKQLVGDDSNVSEVPEPNVSSVGSLESLETCSSTASTTNSRKDSTAWDASDCTPPPSNGKNQQKLDKDTITRLMGAISFGYGLFQLGISLLPPSLLKLTNFLGFAGNRHNGITCLMYARRGVDMRAPLATLSLLWYHTIVRPFYALDGSNVQAGVEAAEELLQESEEEYNESALFLFFKGRVNRLQSNIPVALKSFQTAVDNTTQREIKILALHEVGWCHLIQLDYCAAELTFNYLKSWSRWSRAFYSYIAGICCGSCSTTTSNVNIKEIQNCALKDGRMNQLDEFLSRRVKRCPSDDEAILKKKDVFWKLLVYEMLYLWNALPSCSLENIKKIKRDCLLVTENEVEPMVGLSKLILGACYCIENQYSHGVEAFQTCLDLRRGLAHNADDAHVSAFCQYELGSLLLRSQDTKDEGKLLLQRITIYKDYDFEHRLNVRVHSMLKVL